MLLLGYDGSNCKNVFSFINSWDEMGQYDLPALIDYTLHITNQDEVFYVGHSQGTTQAFAELSRTNNSISKKIKLFVALAPVAKVAHIYGIFKSIAESSFCCFAKVCYYLLLLVVFYVKVCSKFVQCNTMH